MTTPARRHGAQRPRITALAHAICALAFCIDVAAQTTLSLPQLQPLGPPPVPRENRLSEANVLLGKTLFWEEQLSRTGTVACGTCHRPMWSGTDPRTALSPATSTNPGPNAVFGDDDDVLGSAGVPQHRADGAYVESAAFGFGPSVGGRKSPSAINAAFAPELFWDGRAGGTFRDPETGTILIAQGGALENQALGPLVDTAEMGHAGNTIITVGERIVAARPLALASDVPGTLSQWIAGRGYPALFQEVFGTPRISAARIAMAIASYERTLIANRTPLDAELSGTPSLTALERRGAEVFVQHDCAQCHGGAQLTDNLFHNIGVRPAAEDPGRQARTGNPADLGAFRTPALRDVAQRPPFMHDGSLATLEAVVDFYDRGGDFAAPNKSPLIRPLRLTPADKAALLAFLRRPLTDARVAAELPPFDRPTLFTESARVPVHAPLPRPNAALSRLLGRLETPAAQRRAAADAPRPTATTRAAVPGGSGHSPTIVALEPPLIGNTNFTVVLAHARGGARATLVVAAADPGIHAVLPFRNGISIEVFTDGDALDDGDVSAQLSLDQPGWEGRTFFARFYVEDPGARRGLAVSEAVRFTVHR